jgi:quercetin dioxygenase-like cupin family protein
MGIEVHKSYFSDLGEALDDIRKDGYWPTTFVTDASPEIPVHWHDTELHGYVMEGETYILDGVTKERVDFRKGDKLVLTAGTLHAEGETKERMVYLVALPEPKAFGDFLHMFSPDDPERPGA